MKMGRFIGCLAGAVLALTAAAADKLAIAEPVGKGGVKADEIEAFWGILESSIQSDEYTLVSRAALNQILTEIGLTDSSGLVNLNSAQKAQLGRITGVKYILISEVGKFGSRLNCTLRILDSSTGEIDQMRTANLRVADLDELADRIEATLAQLLSDDKQLRRSAILSPVILVSNAPDYLAGDFNIRLESGLMNGGVRLQNLQSVSKILKANRLDALNELEPKMFVKVGKLLEVQNLIQATVSRFEVSKIRYEAAESGASGYRYIGSMEGDVRVISARDGQVLASVPFEEKINFRQLDRAMTRDWVAADYGKYMIKTIVPQQIVPELLKLSALQGK